METSNRAYGQNERGAKQKALLFLSNDYLQNIRSFLELFITAFKKLVGRRIFYGKEKDAFYL